MRYILGVDGGGTKTTARIADKEGNTLGQGVSGASNYHSVGIEKAIMNLNQAINKAWSDSGLLPTVFASCCFGFAGYNTELDRPSYERIVFNAQLTPLLNTDRVLIFNDTRVGLAAGSDCSNKVILIAGTGSNCYGLNQQGQQAKATGWDYILADEGSGYSMGLKALRAIMKAYDGRGPYTLLTDIILGHLGLESIDHLIMWTYQKPFSKDRIGDLSKQVCDAAENGDQVSQQILAEEAKEAVRSVSAVVEKLGLEGQGFDLVMVGGNFKCEKYFKQKLALDLKAKYPGIKFLPLTREPVHGAVKLAIENL